MKTIKANITLINGDIEENVLCKVDYTKKIIILYDQTQERKGFIPLSSVLKFEFIEYYDPENSNNEPGVDEGW